MLSRAALLRQARPRARLVPSLASGSRLASTESHDHGHSDDHHHHADANEYPAERFGTPIWRNTIIISIVAYAAYTYAPSASSDSWLTRTIASWKTDPAVWQQRAEKHLELTDEIKEQTLLSYDAELPRIHRYRYTGRFEQASPHCLPVGAMEDLDSLDVRRDVPRTR